MKQIKTAEEILEGITPYSIQGYPLLYDAVDVRNAMRIVYEQFKPEWTAVEDGLPLEHRKIIFLTDNVLFPDNSYTGTYSQGNWHVSGNYRPVEAKVTHWMYIPNPKQ